MLIFEPLYVFGFTSFSTAGQVLWSTRVHSPYPLCLPRPTLPGPCLTCATSFRARLFSRACCHEFGAATCLQCRLVHIHLASSIFRLCSRFRHQSATSRSCHRPACRPFIPLYSDSPLVTISEPAVLLRTPPHLLLTLTSPHHPRTPLFLPLVGAVRLRPATARPVWLVCRAACGSPIPFPPDLLRVAVQSSNTVPIDFHDPSPQNMPFRRDLECSKRVHPSCPSVRADACRSEAFCKVDLIHRSERVEGTRQAPKGRCLYLEKNECRA